MWYYAGSVFLPKDVSPEFVGFVYSVSRIDNGRIYIGQKRFSKSRKRKPLKGRKRARRDRVASDWQTYYGSNDELLAEVTKFGPENFRREILYLCRSKSEMNYLELRTQIVNDVLLYPEKFYNSFVGTKISRSHLKKSSLKTLQDLTKTARVTN